MAQRTPKYSGQLVKVTGEGEHLTLAFAAGTVDELRAAVGVAGAIALERMRANNEAILDAASTFEARQVQVFTNAVAQLRRELGLSAAGDGNGASEETHADNPTGPIYSAENP